MESATEYDVSSCLNYILVLWRMILSFFLSCGSGGSAQTGACMGMELLCVVVWCEGWDKAVFP